MAKKNAENEDVLNDDFLEGEVEASEEWLQDEGDELEGQLAVDVYQTKDGWIVKVELAGVSSEDLEIDIQGNTLYIAGCRKDTFYGESVTYQQLEITYSRFEKTLEFPSTIEGATIVQDYLDGLLIIRLHAAPCETAKCE